MLTSACNVAQGADARFVDLAAARLTDGTPIALSSPKITSHRRECCSSITAIDVRTGYLDEPHDVRGVKLIL